MRRSLLSASLFAASASAQICSIEGAEGGGFGPRSGFGDIILNPNHNPNATSSVTFNFTTTASNGGTFIQEWTWRVNISEITPPNSSFLGSGTFGNEPDLGDHPAFTNTVYDLQWPGGENLNDYLHNATNNATGAGGRLCFARVDLSGLPHNVTNNYHESDNGDCSNALGAECVSAILANMAPISNSGSCPTAGDLRGIPECASTTGAGTCGIGSLAYEYGNSTETSRLNQTILDQWKTEYNETYPYESGMPVFFRSSGAHRGGNLTWYEESGQILQAIILSGASQPTMVCQKVNKTAAAVESGSGQDSDSNGAGTVGASSITVLALAGLTTLFAVL